MRVSGGRSQSGRLCRRSIVELEARDGFCKLDGLLLHRPRGGGGFLDQRGVLLGALVDQIDGVDFDIPINMDYDDPYQDLHIHFTKGPRHLNGQEAMEVVRFRHNNDGTGYGTEDIGRIGTQQAFLKAVAKQLLQVGNVKNIPALVDIFYTYVKTDLTTGNLVWLGNEALNIGTENIHFATLPGDGSGYYNKQSVYVLDAQATCDLDRKSVV